MVSDGESTLHDALDGSEKPIEAHDKPIDSVLKSVDADVPTEQDEKQIQLMEGPKLYLVTFGLGLAFFCSALDTTVIATAAPVITKHFHVTTDVGWYGSAYFLTTCAFQPIAGKLYSNFSLKLTFFAFFALFEIGSLLCAVSTSSPMLIVGRAVAGSGASGVTSGALAIVSHILPLEKRPMYIGILASTFGIAAVAGPPISGAFTEHVSWRWCFYINLPIGAVTAIVLVLFFRPPARDIEEQPFMERFRKLDFTGALLLMSAVIMALLALQWGGHEHAWKSATIIGLFVGFGLTLIVFVLWQVRAGDNAMIPIRILGERNVIFGGLAALFATGAVFFNIYFLPEWFQVIKDASPARSGVMIIPTAASQMIGMILGGALISRLGWYNPFGILGTALITIASGLYSTFTLTTNHKYWISYQVLQGFGMGVFIQVPLMAMQTALSQKDGMIGNSFAMLCQFFGGALFLTIGTTIFSNSLKTHMAEDAPGVSAADVLFVGSGGVRTFVPADRLHEVLVAYNDAITDAFYCSVAVGVVAFLSVLCLEWKSVKKSAPAKAKEGEV